MKTMYLDLDSYKAYTLAEATDIEISRMSDEDIAIILENYLSIEDFYSELYSGGLNHKSYEVLYEKIIKTIFEHVANEIQNDENPCWHSILVSEEEY